jgi:prophage antirepressor-like protein
MEVVQAFINNKLHTEIIIKGTREEPLFRASDIGEVLGITNIRTNLQNFNENDKTTLTIQTKGGNQDVTFLTEKGLYKILFRSRKPIAEQFQNWICDVIKEVRLTEKYQLEKELNDKYKKDLVLNVEKERHEYLLTSSHMYQRYIWLAYMAKLISVRLVEHQISLAIKRIRQYWFYHIHYQSSYI